MKIGLIATGAVLAATVATPEARAPVVDLQVPGKSLANPRGEPVERNVRVILPNGYDDARDRTYPVVYVLHGFGAGPDDWLGGEGSYEGLDLAATVDSLETAGAVSGLIVVLPDARTELGGSWYTTSSTNGDWETYLSEDMVRRVDGAFRTIPDREHRGIAGQSMGAYGALRLALLRPDVFGAVLAMSPLLAGNPNPLGKMGARLALEADPANLSDAPLPAKVLWSRAIAFSPDPDLPPAYARLPYRREGEEILRDGPGWEHWRIQTLVQLSRSHADALRRLAVRIEIGEKDPLVEEARQLAAELDTLGVAHEFVTFAGGHVRGVRRQFETSVFQFFESRFGPPAR